MVNKSGDSFPYPQLF